MSEPVIEVRGLTRRFGSLTAVAALDLTVAPRTIYGFLGPNGSGKTTTVRMLTGLLTPSAGEVRVLGLELPRDAERLKRRIGYMTQKFSLYDDLTVVENLRFVGEIYGLGRRAARQRIAALLSTYALEPLRDRRAGQMSGGQRQRLALAAATIHEPPLLFLDEPTSAVDPQSRRDFWERLFDLVDAGATILVSTHYMDEAERCHRLAYLAYGNLLAHGTLADVLANGRLTTWTVTGPELSALAATLRGRAGVEQVVAFGTTLHVSGRDAAQLDAAVAAVRSPRHEWKKTRSSLEDVFISLMDQAKDNFA